MCIKKLIGWAYDIGFQSGSSSIQAYNVDFDMGQKNLNCKTQGVCYEENSNVVWQIRQWNTWVTMCIKNLIGWAYDIGFQSASSSIEAYNVGFDMGQKNQNSKTLGVFYEENSNVVGQIR